MLTDNTVLLAALGIALTVLVLVQFFLAARHDHVVSAQGRIASLEALDEQIRTKTATLSDIDEEIRKRREQMENVAENEARIDALTRQRDELLAEWESLGERREEVRRIREETERAWSEHQTATSDLAEAREELEAVRGRLERAEELVGQIERLEERRTALQDEVRGLEEEAEKLRRAREAIVRLEERRRALATEIAEAEGRLHAKSGELEEVREALGRERGQLDDLRAERQKVQTQLITAEEKLDEKRKEIETLDAERGTLEARLDRIRQQIEDAKQERDKVVATGGANGPPSRDPLEELKTKPPVLANLITRAVWSPEDEGEALKRVAQRFEAEGLEYHPRTQRAFHTAMKVNETTQMTVLAGISGTGKSQLPRQYAAGMGIGFLQVPVQPRWDSPQDLMGFYNYIESRFRPTDMARSLWQLDVHNNPEGAVEDRMMMILLDEMNLARVEYYFSDFLSRLESRPAFDWVADASQRKDAEIELEIPMPPGEPTPRVFPGYNLLFAGTMNEDESTQSLSDKVVDRANLMRFAAPKRLRKGERHGTAPDEVALEFSRWRKWVRPASLVEREQRVADALTRMSDLMQGLGRPFGHRLGLAIMAYVANYPDVEGADPVTDALADQVEMRLLPKLRGVELDVGEAEARFDDLRRFVESDLRDEALAEAIGDAVEAARSGTGQFVWTGVTR